ncbi:MAG: glycosyltransferase family 39 protein [Candidatus Omnitrophica bacterium]|nr:glycosyltransferase family 39 protein [Candidatus Omnitrophota bacterium]
MINRNKLLFKKTNLWNHEIFLVDFLIVPLVFFAAAYFIFNRFLKINFFLDDINYLNGLKILVETRGDFYSFIRDFAMRGVAFKPMSLGVDWIVNFKLFGLNPYGYHLFNIVLLSINSFLIYLFIAISFRLRLLGFVISFCYLVHPFNTDGIAWVSGGFTSQNVVGFFCLTLITYYFYLQKHKKIFLIGSYLLFTCAFLSREDAIMWPFLMVFFLLFLGYLHKARAKEVLGYLVIVLLVMATRYWLLYPKVYEIYRWDFTNIQNAFFRNNYYINLALSPLKSLFGKVDFLEKYKILLMLSKTIYFLLVPFAAYMIYKYRKTDEVKLLGFGLVWYCLFSAPFNFMFGQEFLHDRYISMSIIGILMAQVAVITLILKTVLKNNICIKFLLLCFVPVLLLTCNYMVIDKFSYSHWRQYSINTQSYIASINIAIKNNPSIKNINLIGFPAIVKLSELLSLYPDYKDIKFAEVDNEENNGENKESVFTVKYRQIIQD